MERTGAFSPIRKEFLEEPLEGEMEGHLSDEEKGAASGNKRNGKVHKRVKSSHGEVTITTLQDRNISYEPKIIEKRQRILADNLEKQIIAMYGMGNSQRDISDHIREKYDTDISTQVLSEITARGAPKVREWQERPLEPAYYIVRLDTMYFKGRKEGKVRYKALYNILGLDRAPRQSSANTPGYY